MVKAVKLFGFLVVLLFASTVIVCAQDAASGQSEKPKPDFPAIEEVVKDADKLEGFLTLYKKKETLYAEIPSSMMEKPFLISISLARGIAQGYLVAGMTLQESIYYFKLADKKIFLAEKNVRHIAKSGDPIDSAVKQGFQDSIIAAFAIRGKSGGNCLIDLGDFLFTDYVEIGARLGASLDRNRSTWGKIKAFPENVEIEVDTTFSGRQSGDIRTVPDARALPITMHYSFSKIPQTGYKPRMADNRIGFFLTAIKDYSKKGSQEPFVRYINRWNLQKADPNAELSPPKKPIIFYIEKSVPYEYRPIVQAGILEWNKAFEKAGYLNAIEVRIQDENAEWDAEDVRYNTVRWMTGEAGYAIGPSRTNPETGEIYDADILVDSGWLNYFELQYETLVTERDHLLKNPIALSADDASAWETFIRQLRTRTPESKERFDLHATHLCEYAKGLREQMAIAALAAAVQDASPSKKGLPQEFIRQGLKNLITHEVGHTLGLRHNFKSSAMIPLKDLFNKEKAEQNGMIGSVMDYDLVTIAPPGEEQGYYYSPTLGAWDYLAIEYGYKEASPEELKKVAARTSSPPYLYGTDGDVNGIDPLTNTRDMSDDPLAFAQLRVKVITELWKDLANKVTDEGEGYEKVRTAFVYTLSDLQRCLFHASRFVGGFYLNRDQKGDPNESPALEIVPASKQREALNFVCEHALTDTIYQFDPDLLARMAPNLWDHWGSSGSRKDAPIHLYVLSGQLDILGQLYSYSTLERIQNGALYVKGGDDVFTLDEIYRTTTNAIWSELKTDVQNKEWNNQKPFISSYRRDLQRYHLKFFLLPDLLQDPSSSMYVPQDMRSIAWVTLTELKNNIQKLLENVGFSNVKLDPLSEAHLMESKLFIEKALDAAFTIRSY